MKIRWSPTALSDVVSIREYIAQDSPRAAQKVSRTIRDAVERLRSFPLSGRVGRIPGTRELVIPGTSYVAAYKINPDEVVVAAVLHGRQRWPKSF
jgi:toxin ParE1/3/4